MSYTFSMYNMDEQFEKRESPNLSNLMTSPSQDFSGSRLTSQDFSGSRLTSHPENLPPLKTSTLQLDLDELSFLRGDYQYDDMDLLSECSTPCAYSPGRFLQMHDVTDDLDLRDDVTLWPVSLGPSGGEGSVTSLLSEHRKMSFSEQLHEPKYFRQTGRRSSVLTLSSPKVYLPLMLFVLLAFSMLGGLMTVIT